MKVPDIIGVDLSKKTIDFASYNRNQHLRVSNDLIGFEQLLRWLKDQSADTSTIKMVMEHTGLYSYRLEQFLHQQQITYCKVPGLAIKKSMGIVRGKTDKQDAKRIARYGFEKADELCAAELPDQKMQRLQQLHALREKLVASKASLFTALNEMQAVYEFKKTDIIVKTQTDLIKCHQRQIQKIEEELALIVNSLPSVKRNYELLQSIKGVGKVLALACILKTNNFKKFVSARKFACYCGTAPFENTSGSSIRRRTRVSHLADKRMKTLLDLAAKSAIQHDRELKEYYLRRTQNGKSKMSTINVVRNKLLYRIFAIIKRQTPYALADQTQNLNPSL
jgi:transposase